MCRKTRPTTRYSVDDIEIDWFSFLRNLVGFDKKKEQKPFGKGVPKLWVVTPRPKDFYSNKAKKKKRNWRVKFPNFGVVTPTAQNFSRNRQKKR